MDHSVHNKIVSFIWSIADDCLRDIYVRGKYRDIILPMFVLRRLDCLLETTKDSVMEELDFQKKSGLDDLDVKGLQKASKQVFYNTSEFTLQILKDTASNNVQILKKNFDKYLDGFSEDVQEIISKFKLRQKIKEMADADILLEVLEKFTDKRINLSAKPRPDENGKKLPALSNLGMGYVFEELIRKFNEENNEEAGEHFTPREVIELMNYLVFIPVEVDLPNPMLVYDPACGSGGMLTESQNFINDLEGRIASKNKVILYGKEINPETYAICKSDMLIKGNDPKNIKYGSTLSTDSFSDKKFDFMLSNPPYGKSWATEVKHIKDGKNIIDSRFEVELENMDGHLETMDATPGTNDGQLLFLMEMVKKMKSAEKGGAGSRIASVHNGSSLFTGDAGSGASNVRRYLFENDLVEAIIQLPTSFFYNTSISTYIWLLSNNKKEERKEIVQLIDASAFYSKMRRNLGDKNCEFLPEHIDEILKIYLDMPEQKNSKKFSNKHFSYLKAQIEKPLRLVVRISNENIENLLFETDLKEIMEWCVSKYGDELFAGRKTFKKEIEAYIEKLGVELKPARKKLLFDKKFWVSKQNMLKAGQVLLDNFGECEILDFNEFKEEALGHLKNQGVDISASEFKKMLNHLSYSDFRGERVVKKVHKLNEKKLSDLLLKLSTKHNKATEENLGLFGFYKIEENTWVEYESDSTQRDYESIPLSDDLVEYFNTEVSPYVEEAWINISNTKIGCEIHFSKYFYEFSEIESAENLAKEVLLLETESKRLMSELLENHQ